MEDPSMPAELIELDLSECSSTFPELALNPLIPIEPKLRDLQRRFAVDHPSIVLVGGPGTGKTVHLAEFARANRSTSLSYFLTDNYWCRRPTSFLSSLCRQMAAVLDGRNEDSLASQVVPLEIEAVKLLFETQVHRIIELSRRTHSTFYFVIDGLEWAYEGRRGERIADLLPLQTRGNHLYFLGSVTSTAKDLLPLEYIAEEPSTFSSLETRAYFQAAEVSISDELLEDVQAVSGGIPGYLQAMRQLHVDGIKNLAQVIKTPGQVDDLLRIHWKDIEAKAGAEEMSVLALIAYSIVPLNLETICSASGASPDSISQFMHSTGLLRETREAEWHFYPELIRKIAQERLQGMRQNAVRALLSHYEKADGTVEARHLLPEYYVLADDFPSLEGLLTLPYITRDISETADLGGIRRTLADARDMALRQSHRLGLSRLSLLCSQFKWLSNEVIGESEIEALIMLGDFDKALELSYSIRIDLLRARMLARIYAEMQSKGTTVPKSNLDELERMIASVDVSQLDPDEVLLTASAVFAILPEASTAIIDRIKGFQNSKSAMDLIYALAWMKSAYTSDESTIERIENPEIRDFLKSRGPWLSRLAAGEVLRRASTLSRTSAKDFLFREWCRQKDADPDMHLVVDAALTCIISDAGYQVPLRNLRQLSDSLSKCALEHILPLARRFDIPSITSLRAPFEERLRLDLNLAESLSRTEPELAWERYERAYGEFLDTPMDLDVGCYCTARLLISLGVIDSFNIHGLSAELIRRIEDGWIELMESSANQLDIGRRTLRALAAVRPALAMTFAEMLNTVARRDEGLREVLSAYIQQDRIPVEISTISDGLSKIVDEASAAETLGRLLRIANERGRLAHPDLKDFFSRKIDELVDPGLRCTALAEMISANAGEGGGQTRRSLFDQLVESWSQIDVLWIRTELAFDLVVRIGDVDRQLAGELYEAAVALRESTGLANQPVGRLYVDTLRPTARLAGFLSLDSELGSQAWGNLLGAVDRIPSRLLRLHLLARIALARLYGQGDKANFDSLMRDHVLRELHASPPSHQRNRAITACLPAVYEYSPEEALRLVDTLPYLQRNFAYANVVARSLLHLNIGDPFDQEAPNVPIDLPRANTALTLIERIDNDEVIAALVDMLAHLVALPASRLSEAQRLDILRALDDIVDRKLPDLKNIRHEGYKIVLRARIEAARRRSAKKSKAQVARKHGEIAKLARGLTNIADRVFVLSVVAAEFKDVERDLSSALLNEARALVPQIPNARDRLERLEAIIETYGQLGDTTRAVEAIKIAVEIAKSLQGLSRDSLLSSLIETVHQVDPDLAANITEQLETPSAEYDLDVKTTAHDVAKAPHKLASAFAESARNNEIMSGAIDRIRKAVGSQKSVGFSDPTILAWLAAGSHLPYNTMLDILDWSNEVCITQLPTSVRAAEAATYLSWLIEDSEIVYQVGNFMLPLRQIPETMRPSFQGLAVNRKLIRSGERAVAMAWIKSWLQTNAKRYVSICDPYFDAEQLWIHKCVSPEIEVRVICTPKKLQLPRASGSDVAHKRQAAQSGRTQLAEAWRQLSSQEMPPTLVVVHETVFDGSQDDFHDRYLVTDGGGLSLGTSLNGLGNQESFITVLGPDDAADVEARYIAPKLALEHLFARVIFFELP
jgi:hypothetical protein